MQHFMKLRNEPFDMINRGIKVYELRLLDDKRKGISKGDIIEFTNVEKESEKILVKVEDILYYPSFIDLYADLPLTLIGYTEQNKDGASYKDMEKYYSKEEQDKYGVVAIRIKKI